uniref:Peroxisomal carnitine O-octanoyltransferase n=1 Tax=Cacopsylla melanoneura TaxID=428564 RepID=A0A8D8Y349_9HEMI
MKLRRLLLLNSVREIQKRGYKGLLGKYLVISEEDKVKSFENDENLSSLPVPPLDLTLDRYIQSIKPFATHEEITNVERLAKEFKNGVGQELQKSLLKKASEEKNWLSGWWEKYAYLMSRDPLIPFANMFGPNPTEELGLEYGPGKSVQHASIFCHELMKFWILLRREKLKPQVGTDNKPFCMHTFKKFFNTARIPGEEIDSIVNYFKTEAEGNCPSHVIVQCNGHIYKINALHEDFTALSVGEWKKQLTSIIEGSLKSKGKGIGCLSCDPRSKWAENRSYIMSRSAKNKQLIEDIDSAIFSISLDSTSPTNDSEICQQMISNDYANRYADKSVAVIFFKNGASGGICEHTAFDGMVNVTACFYVLLSLAENMETLVQDNKVSNKLAAPVPLEFDTDDKIDEELKRAVAEQKTSRYEVSALRKAFTDYGKEEITELKLHPDSFVQLSLQLAYYTIHKKPAPCYETATTRLYYRGRTETVRSCTLEASEFAKAMLSSTDNETKRNLLKMAIEKHNELMREAKEAQGIDRHMFGLYIQALEQGIPPPEIFIDPLMMRSGGGGNYVLSTSLTGYTPIGGGVGPMVLDGYGVFYNIMPDKIFFTVTTRRSSTETNSEKYFQVLCKSLHDMRNLYA